MYQLTSLPRLRIALAMALGLLASGCGREAPAPASMAWRPPGAPIWSIAAFDPARLPGDWVEVAAFAPQGAACRTGRLRIGRGSQGGPVVKGALCRTGGETAIGGKLTPTGRGRMNVAGEAEPWWVLWVDTDYRTLVIGTPSGRFGHVLNRGGALPGDRMKAAREILDWNGYDLAGLRDLR